MAVIHNSLLNLDFRPGIRDTDINYNFDLVKKWIDRERLRIGGWGIVEGFDFTKNLTDFSVHISDGVLINEAGEEVLVAEHLETVGPPVFQKYKETVTVGNSGIIQLQFPIYSDVLHANAWYVPPEHLAQPTTDELEIIDIETNTIIPWLSIYDNVIVVNTQYAGRQVAINYLYSNDRIDAVLLTKDGEQYLFQKGILSTSASSPELEQYKETHYLIGFCLWHVGTTVDVEFITWGRQFRPIYVDDNNVLWLNGEIYQKSQFIYFVEPENPQENDLWYDKITNTLYIWMNQNGIWGWQPINDHSDSPIRTRYIFTDDMFPEDNQTFLFPESENMQFVPGMKELDILIDNAPLMSDQFSEIVQKGEHEYEDIGIGFKLIEPLDRYTPVEVVITHAVRTFPANETFQRMAMFTYENHQPYNLNQNKIVETDVPFEAGENQLEVWVDGIRLVRNKEFYEVLDNSYVDVTEENRGQLISHFRLNLNIQANQEITYKITRHMWSYENLQKVIDGIQDSADAAFEIANNTKEDLTTFIDVEYEKTKEDLFNRIGNIQIPDMTEYLKKDAILTEDNIPSSVMSNLFANRFDIYTSAQNAIIPLENVSDTDYIQAFYVTSSGTNILIYNTDFTLQKTDNACSLVLNPRFVTSDPGTQVYITGIHFGR